MTAEKHWVGLNNLWINHWWEIRVLAFYISNRGNYYLYLIYFLKKDKQFRVFRLGLVYILMQNYFLGNMSNKDNLEGTRNRKKAHHLDTAPAHAKK